MRKDFLTCEPYPLDVDEVMLGVPTICLAIEFVTFCRTFFAVLLTIFVELFTDWKLFPMSRNDPIVLDVGKRDFSGGFVTTLSSWYWLNSESLLYSSISSVSVCLVDGSSCNVVMRKPILLVAGDASESKVKQNNSALKFVTVKSLVSFEWIGSNSKGFKGWMILLNLRFDDVCCRRREFKFRLRFKNVGRAVHSG